MIEGQPLPYYQPLIDTATGRIAGYEALARLRAEDGQVISAGPLFSDPQVDPAALLELDRSVRRQAAEYFAQVAGWPESGCAAAQSGPAGRGGAVTGARGVRDLGAGR